MAEAVGLVASVLGIAGFGLKLSKTLREAVSDVRNAPQHVHDLATSITHFSRVLYQVGQCFSEKGSPHSWDALTTVNGVVKHCDDMYSQLHDMVVDLKNFKDRQNGKGRKKDDISFLKRIQWIFKKSTIRELTRKLDSEKATLTMMLQTIQLRSAMNSSKQHDEQGTSLSSQIEELRLLVQELVIDRAWMRQREKGTTKGRTRSKSPASFDSSHIDESRQEKELPYAKQETYEIETVSGTEIDESIEEASDEEDISIPESDSEVDDAGSEGFSTYVENRLMPDLLTEASKEKARTSLQPSQRTSPLPGGTTPTLRSPPKAQATRTGNDTPSSSGSTRSGMSSSIILSEHKNDISTSSVRNLQALAKPSTTLATLDATFDNPNSQLSSQVIENSELAVDFLLDWWTVAHPPAEKSLELERRIEGTDEPDDALDALNNAADITNDGMSLFFGIDLRTRGVPLNKICKAGGDWTRSEGLQNTLTTQKYISIIQERSESTAKSTMDSTDACWYVSDGWTTSYFMGRYFVGSLRYPPHSHDARRKETCLPTIWFQESVVGTFCRRQSKKMTYKIRFVRPQIDLRGPAKLTRIVHSAHIVLNRIMPPNEVVALAVQSRDYRPVMSMDFHSKSGHFSIEQQIYHLRNLKLLALRFGPKDSKYKSANNAPSGWGENDEASVQDTIPQNMSDADFASPVKDSHAVSESDIGTDTDSDIDSHAAPEQTHEQKDKEKQDRNLHRLPRSKSGANALRQERAASKNAKSYQAAVESDKDTDIEVDVSHSPAQRTRTLRNSIHRNASKLPPAGSRSANLRPSQNPNPGIRPQQSPTKGEEIRDWMTSIEKETSSEIRAGSSEDRAIGSSDRRRSYRRSPRANEPSRMYGEVPATDASRPGPRPRRTPDCAPGGTTLSFEYGAEEPSRPFGSVEYTIDPLSKKQTSVLYSPKPESSKVNNSKKAHTYIRPY